jgi:nucleoside-diphosphate-sugar epimerase
LKKILLFGGNGFIGKNLVKYYFNKNYKITVIDINKDNNNYYINNNRLKYIFKKDELDFFKYKYIRNIIKNSDIIFYLASTVGVRNTVLYPDKVIDNSLIPLQEILKYVTNKNKFLFFSTSEVYANNAEFFGISYSNI